MPKGRRGIRYPFGVASPMNLACARRYRRTACLATSRPLRECAGTDRSAASRDVEGCGAPDRHCTDRPGSRGSGIGRIYRTAPELSEFKGALKLTVSMYGRVLRVRALPDKDVPAQVLDDSPVQRRGDTDMPMITWLGFIGEPHRAFYGNHFGADLPAVRPLRCPSCGARGGGALDSNIEAHDLVMSVSGGMSKGERNRIKVRVRTAMSPQAAHLSVVIRKEAGRSTLADVTDLRRRRGIVATGLIDPTDAAQRHARGLLRSFGVRPASRMGLPRPRRT